VNKFEAGHGRVENNYLKKGNINDFSTYRAVINDLKFRSEKLASLAPESKILRQQTTPTSKFFLSPTAGANGLLSSTASTGGFGVVSRKGLTPSSQSQKRMFSHQGMRKQAPSTHLMPRSRATIGQFASTAANSECFSPNKSLILSQTHLPPEPSHLDQKSKHLLNQSF
jgi:hypothetical protein